MFDAFAVMLRESAELILILSSLAACLRSSRAVHLLPLMKAGTAGGCIAGIVLSLCLITSGIDLRWIAGLTFALAIGVLLMVSTMLLTAHSIRSRTQAFIEIWLERRSAPLIILLFATTVAFRESLEVGLFLRTQWLRSGAIEVLTGAALGIVVVLCLALTSRKLSTRIGMQAAFRVSALLLTLLAIRIMLEALAEFVHASATAEHGASLLAWTQFALPQGRWHGEVFAVLMALSVGCVLRSWWKESSA